MWHPNPSHGSGFLYSGTDICADHHQRTTWSNANDTVLADGDTCHLHNTAPNLKTSRSLSPHFNRSRGGINFAASNLETTDRIFAPTKNDD